MDSGHPHHAVGFVTAVRRGVHLHPSPEVLVYRSAWALHAQSAVLVHQRGRKHRNRPGHLHHAAAGFEIIATAQEAKVLSHGDLQSGIFVRETDTWTSPPPLAPRQRIMPPLFGRPIPVADLADLHAAHLPSLSSASRTSSKVPITPSTTSPRHAGPSPSCAVALYARASRRSDR